MKIPPGFAVAVLALLCCLGPAASARAQVFELIDAFAGCPEEGCGAGGDIAHPAWPLILGPDGHFYGMSGIDSRIDEEEPRSWGAIFRIDTAGHRTILHRFNCAGPGDYASGSMAFGPDGALYGIGARCRGHNATIFRLVGDSFEILQEFPTGGFIPLSIVAGPGGTLYGFGFYSGGPFPLGRQYKWTGDITVLATEPVGGLLLRAPDGNLYFPKLGTLFGTAYENAVYRITSGDVVELVHEFGSEGHVQDSFLLGGDGNLYGHVVNPFGPPYFNTPYRLTLSGAVTLLNAAFGRRPLAAGVDGSVFVDGGGEHGAIDRLPPGGVLEPVHTFNYDDGSGALLPLTQGPDGHLYGIRPEGGAHGLGTFYRIRMPRVDVKANGGDGPITVAAGDPLEISLAFDAAPTTTINPSEVYVAVVTPALEVFWMTASGFTTTPTRLYAGPLAAFGPVPLLTLTDAGVLPAGDYYWVTIVDSDANGVPNWTFVDFVKTRRTP